MRSSDNNDPVVVSGVGVVHGLGNSWEEFGTNLGLGRVSIRPLCEHPGMGDHVSTARMFSWLADLPVPDGFPVEKGHLLSRLSRLALTCAGQASAMAGPPLPGSIPGRTGVFLGSGMGNLCDLDPVYARYHSPKGKRGLSPLTLPVHMNNSPANQVSQQFGAEGPSLTLSTACASGLSAFFLACDSLLSGQTDRALAGGVDLTVCPTLVDAWDKLGVLSPEQTDPTLACRPLHRDRSGMVLSEGGAVFVLERWSTCKRRSGRPLAVVEGYHQNCDAHDLVVPRPETQALCLAETLAKAGAATRDIDQIHLHATATPRNDRQELEVLSSLFGNRLAEIPLAAIKAQTGHALGASGVLSLAAALHAWHYGTRFALPDRNGIDWPFPLLLDGTAGEYPLRTLIQCFAMGGTNAGLVVLKP